MWRTAIALIAAVVLAGAALAVRAVVSTDDARVVVERRLAAWLGGPVSFSGRAEMRLMPLPNVRFRDIVVTRAGEPAPIAEAETLVARVGLWGLFTGRTDLVSVSVSRPTLRLAAAPLDRLPGLVAQRLADAPIGRFEIDEGRLILTRPAGGGETVRIEEARLVRNSAASGVTVDATIAWRDRPVTLALRRPTAEAGTAPTGAASLKLSAPSLDLDFAGATAADGVTGGNLKATLADPGDFVRWLGSPIDPSLVDGAVRLDGRLEITGPVLTLAGARLDLAGDRGEGALSLRLDGPRPRLAATLAFDTIDHHEARQRVFGNGVERLSIAKILPPIDLDLRLSATRLVTDLVSLGRVAASVAVTERKVLLEIGNADLWSTSATAVLRGEVGSGGLEAQVRASISDLPIETAFEAMKIPGVDSGRAAVTVEAEARCTRVADCLPSLAGRARVEAKVVKVSGPSPFADTGRFHPIVVRAAAPTSTATWDRLDAELHFAGRHARVDRLDIDARGPRFALTGSGDLLTGALDLVGNAQFPAPRADPSRPAVDPVVIPIRVGGTIRGPQISQRTPGAAPTGGEPSAPAPNPTRPAPQP